MKVIYPAGSIQWIISKCSLHETYDTSRLPTLPLVLNVIVVLLLVRGCGVFLRGGHVIRLDNRFWSHRDHVMTLDVRYCEMTMRYWDMMYWSHGIGCERENRIQINNNK